MLLINFLFSFKNYYFTLDAFVTIIKMGFSYSKEEEPREMRLLSGEMRTAMEIGNTYYIKRIFREVRCIMFHERILEEVTLYYGVKIPVQSMKCIIEEIGISETYGMCRHNLADRCKLEATSNPKLVEYLTEKGFNI